MDYNYLLLASMMPSGRYDVWGRRFEMRTGRVLLNRCLSAICLFCSVKCFFITVLPLRTKAILYLSELYIFETPSNVVFQTGATLMHLSSFCVYLYMNRLCQDGTRFDCLRFLFVPSLKDLCRRYDLDAKKTKKFFTAAAYIRYLNYCILIAVEVFF